MRRQRALLLALGVTLAAAAPPGAATAQVARDSAPAPAARISAAARDTLMVSAERAARAWLGLLDERSYERAWTLVAPAMKSLVTYRRWAASLGELRATLPHASGRELHRAERMGALFGGESVLLSFASPPADAREIVVLVRAPGAWQIGGYGILRN